MSTSDKNRWERLRAVTLAWLGLGSLSAARVAHPPPALFRRYWMEGFREGLINVLLLAAMVSVAHYHEWFDGLTVQSLRLAHWMEQRYAWSPNDSWKHRRLSEPDDKTAATVTRLQLSPKAFAAEFCGVTPVSRPALALFLERVAGALAESPEPASRPVIGIDIDITAPAQRAAAANRCSPEAPADGGASMILAAIQRLQGKADVIAIAFPRDGDDIARRNKSMADLCAPAVGARFATPYLVADPGEPFFRFLQTQRSKPWDEAVPPHYPSLGNLMALEANPRVGATRSLRFVCERVHDKYERGEPIPFIDADPTGLGHRPEARFHWKFLDLLRGETRAKAIRIDSMDQVEPQLADAREVWRTQVGRKGRPMLLLSVDDGISDRHQTVMDRQLDTGGDLLNAMNALSFLQPLERHEGSHLWQGTVWDIFIGAIYLALWTACRWRIARLHKSGRTFWARAIAMVGPALLVIALGFLFLQYAVHRLSAPAWEDPVLILIGLAVHSYLTLWELGEERQDKDIPIVAGDLELMHAFSAMRLGVTAMMLSAVLWLAVAG